MSLMKKRTMTEKRKAAARANGTHSRGPATRAGRERIGAANLRHGLYSQSESRALACLGDEPKDFECLRQGIYATFPPTDAVQEQWVERLATAVWRLERISRRQEESSLRLASEVFAEQRQPNAPASDHSASAELLLRMENSQFREVMRISTLLMDLQHPKRKQEMKG
jgi:hypothetical protein